VRAVVTGAAGFIGSHLCRRLRREGFEVRGLLLPGEDSSALEQAGVEVHRGDLLAPPSLRGLIQGGETVFHLAARVLDWGKWEAFHGIIVGGTKNLLEHCRGACRFVFLSSIAAYGVGRTMQGFTEEMPCIRTGIPYGDSKMEAEGLVRTWCGTNGVDFTIIRPANVIGPGSVWVREALNTFHRGPVPLIGGGDFSASLVGVDNLVEGIRLAATRQEGKQQCFNLRDDWKVTWRRYLTELGSLVGKEPRGSLPFSAVWALGSLLETVCNPLGLRPPMTRLMAGITGRNNDVSTKSARQLLGWESRVSYEEAMERIKDWVERSYCPPAGGIPGRR
jgi:2-alkyl-3-oxoalkanoate reductase